MLGGTHASPDLPQGSLRIDQEGVTKGVRRHPRSVTAAHFTGLIGEERIGQAFAAAEGGVAYGIIGADTHH